MKKITLLVLFIATLFQSCKKTDSPDYYIIDGEINNYNGAIYLSREVHGNYYLDNFRMDSIGLLEKSFVENGKFEFKLNKSIKTPLPFHLMTEKSKTNRFILTPSDHQITIDSFYFNVSPEIISKDIKIFDEQKFLFKRKKALRDDYMLKAKKVRDSEFSNDSVAKLTNQLRKELFTRERSMLLEFVKEHPSSYVSFWELVLILQYSGYSKELELAYNCLSTSIKNSEVSKIFELEMSISKGLKLGARFPKMKLQNIDLNETIFQISENSKATYTLIDFWFSYCRPCIAEFPKLKELQRKYPNKLKIISISTDKTKNIDNWYKMIDKHNITWDNYLDENGAVAGRMGINSFPTKFLLNNDGIVLEKGIPLKELEILLEKVD